RLRQQKCARDFVGGQSTERSQGERDLRFAIPRRMAACEYQSQSIIRKSGGGFVERRTPLCRRLVVIITQQLALLAPSPLTARDIDELAMRRCRDPRTGIVWNALLGPVRERGGERILHRLFRAIERAAQADQRCDDPPVLASERSFDNRACACRVQRGGNSISGRISMHPGPPRQPLGIFLAHSIASSRSRQSIR